MNAFLIGKKLYAEDLFTFCKGLNISLNKYNNGYPPYVELTDKQQLQAIKRGAKWGGPEGVKHLRRKLRDPTIWIGVWIVGFCWFFLATFSRRSIMSVRESFVEHFGEEQTQRIIDAAYSHANITNSKNKGDDPFKWAVLICIGYDCVDTYSEHHGITISPEKFKEWCINFGELSSHNGCYDYLAALDGVYNKYIGE